MNFMRRLAAIALFAAAIIASGIATPATAASASAGDASSFDGRVLSEAFANGVDGEQLPVQVRTHFVESGDGKYRAALQVTELGRQVYIDKGWRIR